MIGLAFWVVFGALIYGVYMSYSEHGRIWLPVLAMLSLGVTGYITAFQFGTWGFAAVGIIAAVVWLSNMVVRP